MVCESDVSVVGVGEGAALQLFRAGVGDPLDDRYHLSEEWFRADYAGCGLGMLHFRIQE